VALTFDDGPHLRDTPRVLDVLAKHEVHGTFHLMGRYAEQHRHLIQEIGQRGHQLALHGYRHVPFPLEDPSRLRADLDRTRTVIANVSGTSPETIQDLRPPYGTFTKQTLAHVTSWGYRLVMWTCIPPHWMQPVTWSIRQVMSSIVPGAVIVLHDGHGHGTRVAEILEAILPRIKSLGYAFVTVEEMQMQREQRSAGS
jgi:peptidoglycan/xylan/chitin deacetylase (PgdA/CDA1 family)